MCLSLVLPKIFFFRCSFPNSCHQQSQERDAMCYVYISTPFGSTNLTSVSKVCHRYYCLVQSTVKNLSPFIHAHATNRTQTCCGIYELYSLSLCHTCPPMIELFPVPVSFLKTHHLGTELLLQVPGLEQASMIMAFQILSEAETQFAISFL